MKIALAIAALCACAAAQPLENNYRVPGSAAGMAPRIVSPEVHGDRTATFRMRAPKASEVNLLLSGANLKPQPMKKDESGLWSVTVGPLAPEIYTYVFQVDGMRTLDMSNPVLKNGRMPDASLVEVPGDPPRFDEVRDVPHGTVQIRRYNSTPLKIKRKLYVYVPPQYEAEPKRKFPVLYLRHGSGDNEANWSEDGRAGIILDNLLAQKKAVPMLIVMSNGDTDGTWLGGSSPQAMDLLGKELIGDIMPLVEKSYRVLTGPGNRALTGLSMGGGQAFTIGFKNLDKFAWIGEFSSGLVSDNQFDLAGYIPGLLDRPSEVNDKLKLLFLSCGTEDPRYNGQLNLAAKLKEHGIRYVRYSTPGGHEWKVWRHSLAEFLQRAFQD